MKNLTRERALELHRQMWSDMQEALGDNPSRDARWAYKDDWVMAHFPNECIAHDCFLCEYYRENYLLNGVNGGKFDYDKCVCPIKWPAGRCEDGLSDSRWDYMPISKLLALPERKIEVEE